MDDNNEHFESPPIPTPASIAKTDASAPERVQVTELRLDAGGVWSLHSAGSTVYFLNTDLRLLMRKRGEESSHFDHDDEWVPLIDVQSSRGDHAVVRVGDRHRFLTDPEGGARDYRFSIARPCTRIEAVRGDGTTSPHPTRAPVE
jgi:hypothetical protein